MDDEHQKKAEPQNSSNNINTLLKVVMFLLVVILCLLIYLFFFQKHNVTVGAAKVSVYKSKNKHQSSDSQVIHELLENANKETKEEINNILNTFSEKLDLFLKRDFNDVLSEIEKIKKELNKVDIEQILLSKIASLIEEARINFNYWGKKERAIGELNKALISLKTLKTETAKLLNIKIKELIKSIKEIKIISKSEIIKFLDEFAHEINKLDFDKLKSTKEKSKIIEASNKKESTESAFKEKIYAKLQDMKQYIKVSKKDSKNEFKEGMGKVLTKEKLLVVLEEAKLSVLSNDNNTYHAKLIFVLTTLDDIGISQESVLRKKLQKLNSIDLNKSNDLFKELGKEIDKIFLEI